MERKTFIILLIGLFMAGLGVSYAGNQMFQRVQLKPIVIQGIVEINAIGKDLQPEDEGNIIKAYDIDTHQVEIKDSSASFNGVSVVQYKPTRESLEGASEIEQKSYLVNVTILSKNKGNAFVLFEGDSASYKIILDTQDKSIRVYEYKNGLFWKGWKKSYPIALYRNYEIYLGDFGSSSTSRGQLKITESKFKNGCSVGKTTVVSTSFEKMGLDSIADAKLLKFYVGAEASTVSFFNEVINIFEDV